LTLIEVVVVITILALLTTMVGVYAVGVMNSSKVKTSRLELRQARDAVELFHASRGRYPTTAEAFAPLLAAHVLKTIPKDAWGQPLHYALEDGEPVVRSLGADGQPGGTEDSADLSSTDEVDE
jgi:general secretion pathway protein G